MKYLRYTLILLFKIFAKIFGLFWYYVAVPFRGYARNTIYNYVISNNIYLKRLEERKPILIEGRYVFKNIRNTHKIGYLKPRDISELEYYLVLFLLWGWVDDDSNYDTHDGSRDESPLFYGNAFDLGDTRAKYPIFNFERSTLWNIRNTAYNFNYLFEEIRENDKNFFYKRFTNKWFDWHFGFIPYTNSTRKGRMVWFSEDIDKLD